MLLKHRRKKGGKVRQEMKMESGKGKAPDMKVAMKETCKCMKPSTSSVKLSSLLRQNLTIYSGSASLNLKFQRKI